jgi:molecular chaperone HtpG
MVVFGKNILENITTGMYADSRVMYREYVQNACDAIDTAVLTGIIARETTRVDINIDQNEREIRIRDNGIGIPKDDFVRVLSDIANSDKKREVNKGFRGIGRLCGLAYCDKLTFKSTSVGETAASVMIWDACQLRTMLNDDRKYTADEVLKAILQTSKASAAVDDHFFEVIMTNVTSQDLLNRNIIRDYLSFEIPVAYHNKFMFDKCIYDYAKSLGINIDEYNIFVNDEPVFKDYKTRIYSGGKVHYEIKELRFKNFYDEHKKLIAWMWFGLSSLDGQIKEKDNLQRGIRLRKDNIQIGESGTLRRLFKDPRGNEYFIGEVFAVHSDLIPNARRDYFNENAIRDIFETQLRNFFDSLWKLCNVASGERSAYQKIKDYRIAFTAYEEKKKTGFSGDVDRKKMQTSLEEKRQQAERAQNSLKKSQESKDKDDVITALVKNIVRNVETAHIDEEPFKPLPTLAENEDQTEGKKAKPIFITNEFSRYTKETRRIIRQIYDLINQNAPDIAQDLIAKIHAGLKSKKE